VNKLNGLRVLVVDDSVDTRELMALVLGTEGVEVITAASAREALAALEGAAVDVLVCDIGLPDVDGCALLEAVRDLPRERGGHTPAIALTGYSDPETRDRIAAAGYQAHAVKPIEPARLAEMIARVAGRDCCSKKAADA
jgi:CheY-like chemotaxis protein